MMTTYPDDARLRWPRSVFASRTDPRFSYCLHLPSALREGTQDVRLLVAVHGSNRNAVEYRDALVPFAERNGYVVLAPLFPIDPLGTNEADGYKYLAEGALRYDHVLLGMVAEVEALLGVVFPRFDLFGFSGGAHFAHRFFYLHAGRLSSVTVGAPGGVTLIDDTRDFWVGTRDFRERFGAAPDLEAMRETAALLLVGAEDTTPFVYPPQASAHVADMEALGRNRVERNETLWCNWLANGLQAEREMLPGIAHEGLKVLPRLERFLEDRKAVDRTNPQPRSATWSH